MTKDIIGSVVSGQIGRLPGKNYSDGEILEAIRFQDLYFHGKLIR